jgi:hypothetical protein
MSRSSSLLLKRHGGRSVIRLAAVRTTVAGVASKVGEAAVEENHFGDLIGAHSYRSLALELPVYGIAIDCDHDHYRVGELLYAETPILLSSTARGS